MITKTCSTCKNYFSTLRETQIYCNQKCYAKSEKLKENSKNSEMIQMNKNKKWHTGYNHSEETKEQIRQNTSKKIGENNPLWKGNDVKMCALHEWIFNRKKWTGKCAVCGFESALRKEIQLANISGEYYRDINDFEWLCIKCHSLFDRLKRKKLFNVIGVECKSNGTLTKEEKEKCRRLLKNNTFSKILIASKGTKRGEIIYNEFQR